MATIAEFSIPAEEFALRETLERRPEMVFELDRVVAYATDNIVPFVRATHGDFEELTLLLDTDASIEEVELLADNEDERLYRMVWRTPAQVIGYMIVEQGAAVQTATATNGRWHLRVLFPERRGLQMTHKYAQEHERSFDITHIYSLDSHSQAQFKLTDEQREALIMALENGYYDIPRKMNQEDLADELDISHQALSERLRRATKRLADNSLFAEEDRATD